MSNKQNATANSLEVLGKYDIPLVDLLSDENLRIFFSVIKRDYEREDGRKKNLGVLVELPERNIKIELDIEEILYFSIGTSQIWKRERTPIIAGNLQDDHIISYAPNKVYELKRGSKKTELSTPYGACGINVIQDARVHRFLVQYLEGKFNFGLKLMDFCSQHLST